jgi:hypothetical protein
MLDTSAILESSSFLIGEIGDIDNEIFEARCEITRRQGVLDDYTVEVFEAHGPEFMHTMSSRRRGHMAKLDRDVTAAHAYVASLHQDRANALDRLRNART